MKYACPCCEYLTFDNIPDGSYDICPVCFWEDDAQQNQNPELKGGANTVSLKEAKKNFRKFNACEERFTKYVRKPLQDELK